MKLKKGIVSALLISSLLIVGCSNKEPEIKDVPVVEIQNNLKATENLLPLGSMESDAKEHYIFENVKDSIIEGFVSQAMINVKLQDVMVIKTDAPDAIIATIEDYKENNLRMFGDGYGGEDNIKAVADSIIGTKGQYVYFIATTNAAEVETALLNIIE